MESPLPEIVTERLLLRALRESDAPAIFEYASNPNLTRYTGWDTHESIDATRAFLASCAASYEKGLPDPFGIALREAPDRVIGSLGCRFSSEKDQAMDLGYVLAEPYWGRGLVAEAGRLLLEYVFENYPVERIQARCADENRASARVMEKLGMQFEGTARAAMLHRGRFFDMRIFSVLRSEWATDA